MNKLMLSVISLFLITPVFANAANESAVTCPTGSQIKNLANPPLCEDNSCVTNYTLNNVMHRVLINGVATTPEAQAILDQIGSSHSIKPGKTSPGDGGYYYCTYQPWPKETLPVMKKAGIYVADVFGGD